jgi:hypothetical protein
VDPSSLRVAQSAYRSALRQKKRHSLSGGAGAKSMNNRDRQDVVKIRLDREITEFWTKLGVKYEPQTPDENGFSFSDFINGLRFSNRSKKDKEQND